MAGDQSTPRLEAQKATRWLEELYTKVGIMRTTDYRTTAYEEAVDEVLRLCKRDYVANALRVIQRIDPS